MFVLDWESTATIPGNIVPTTGDIFPKIAYLLDDDLFLKINEEQTRRERGEVPWDESYRRSVRMFVDYGLREDRLYELLPKVVIPRPGLLEIYQFTMKHSIPLVVITGGFSCFVTPPYSYYCDKIISNEPVFKGGYLTDVNVRVNGNKEKHLRHVCQYYGVPIERSVAVGDGKGDNTMLKESGFAVAVNNAHDVTKEAVRTKGERGYIMQGDDFTELLNVLYNTGI